MYVPPRLAFRTPSMIEAELRAGQERPHHLSDRFVLAICSLLQKSPEQPYLFWSRCPAEYILDGQIDDLVRVLQLLNSPQEHGAAIAKEVFLDAIAVAEQHRFRHAHLEIVARLFEERGVAPASVVQSFQFLLQILRPRIACERL